MSIRFVSRLTVLLVACSSGLSSLADVGCDSGWVRTRAVQDIEYLQRAYARATDAIGIDTEAEVEAGRRVYQRIFTPDAKIGASGIDGKRTGPDAWVEVVRDALGPMGPTQHFIGTQTVDIDALEVNEHCEVVSGSAQMDSHVQAWHDRADGKVWIFVGNYADRVVFTPKVGWQIADMQLVAITEEVR